ncbi:MAG: glycosyltransferase [Clostridium fessum]
MIRLSLCMIVKNEEAVLTRVLASAIQFADEILVADTGSTDRTVEISRQYTKHIYHYPWNDDFAAARNFICEKVSTEYWMWLDADDIVPAESIAADFKVERNFKQIPADLMSS